MKSTPILFKPDMIRAIQREIESPGSGKTMTRRVVKGDPHTIIDRATPEEWDAGRAHPNMRRFEEWGPKSGTFLFRISTGSVVGYPCPYGQKGDLLWVRETWQPHPEAGASYPEGSIASDAACYAADISDDDYKEAKPWKPSIFMPKWASRYTLLIEDVRVERLQDISGPDCMKEGIIYDADWAMIGPCEADAGGLIENFGYLWDSINGKTYPWESNPWVWVICFRPMAINVLEYMKCTT